MRTPCSSTGPRPTLSIALPARRNVCPPTCWAYIPNGRLITRSGQRSLAAFRPMHGLGSTLARVAVPWAGWMAAAITATSAKAPPLRMRDTTNVLAATPLGPGRFGPMAEAVRILSIDGGGIRGIIPALVLVELEKRSGKRTFELFDLIAGTSTGGILACALCAPGPLPASQVVGLYRDRGPDIFDRSLFQRIKSAEGLLDEKYDPAGLDKALKDILSDKRLSEAKPDLIVPSYDTNSPAPYFFKTTKARESPADDFPLSTVARATSAAPTYFEAEQVGDKSLVDGGVFAVNPGMCALAEVLRFKPGAEVVLLSLGTGQRTTKRPWNEIKDWGLVEWARPILEVVFD